MSSDVNEIDTISPPKLIDATTRFRRRKEKNCGHLGEIILDEDNRCVECLSCGAVVDPFDWLVHLAVKESEYFRRFSDVVREWERLTKSTLELRRRERNAKARVNRWEARAEIADRGGLPEIRPPPIKVRH